MNRRRKCEDEKRMNEAELQCHMTKVMSSGEDWSLLTTNTFAEAANQVAQCEPMCESILTQSALSTAVVTFRW